MTKDQLDRATARMDKLIEMEQTHHEGLREENGVGAYPNKDYDEVIGRVDKLIIELQDKLALEVS